MKNKRLAFLALLLGVALMAIAGVKLHNIQQEYSKLNDYYLRQEAEAVAPDNQASDAQGTSVDFDKLKSENQDIHAWLKIPAISLSYPVLQGESNDTYLRHLPNGAYNIGGSLFIDERCRNDFSSPVTVIYGHTLRNGTMFSQLYRFADTEFCKQNGQIYLYTPSETISAKALACIEIDDSSALYNLPTAEDYAPYFALCNELFHTDCNPEAQHILLLSTCSHAVKTKRTVVLAVY